MQEQKPYSEIEGINFSLLKYVDKGPRELRNAIEKYSSPKTTFKNYFDFGDAFEANLIDPNGFITLYGSIDKAPDPSGKYATYGRIIADAIVLKKLEIKSSPDYDGGPINIDADWLQSVKERAHLLSTLAGDIDKADKELEKEPYKSYFSRYIEFEGRVCDTTTWALLETLALLANQNTLFKHIMSLPKTFQEVLTWEVDGYKCKGKSDIIAVDDAGMKIYLVDIKSTKDKLHNGDFVKSITLFGYDDQLYGYNIGIEQSPRYKHLIEKGYTIEVYVAAGRKIDVLDFAMFKIEFTRSNYIRLRFRLDDFTMFTSMNTDTIIYTVNAEAETRRIIEV